MNKELKKAINLDSEILEAQKISLNEELTVATKKELHQFVKNTLKIIVPFTFCISTLLLEIPLIIPIIFSYFVLKNTVSAYNNIKKMNKLDTENKKIKRNGNIFYLQPKKSKTSKQILNDERFQKRKEDFYTKSFKEQEESLIYGETNSFYNEEQDFFDKSKTYFDSDEEEEDLRNTNIRATERRLELNELLNQDKEKTLEQLKLELKDFYLIYDSPNKSISDEKLKKYYNILFNKFAELKEEKEFYKEQLIYELKTFYLVYDLPELLVYGEEWDVFYNIVYNKFVELGKEKKFYETMSGIQKKTVANCLVNEVHEININNYIQSLSFLYLLGIDDESVKKIQDEIKESLPKAKIFDLKSYKRMKEYF